MRKATTTLIAALAILVLGAAAAFAAGAAMVDVDSAADGTVSGSVALDDVCEITGFDVAVDGASVLDGGVEDPAAHFGWDCAEAAAWSVDGGTAAGSVVVAEVVVASDAGSASQMVRYDVED